MSERTFKVRAPHMTGSDVKSWQETLNRQMKTWNVAYRIATDGDYGPATRDLTATVCHGLGLSSAAAWMKDGVTPALRIKLRNKHLTAAEKVRYAARAPWRGRLRKRHGQSGRVATPIAKILQDSWGYHPPVHDGVDLICQANAPLHAICDGTVIRADPGGWWGKGAPSAAVAAKGDGIIVIRCGIDAGPFKKGLNFCYGHAEHPTVREGQRVRAGQVIGVAGLANAWHTHFMVNGRNDDRGVGDRDPMPFVRYAQKRGR